MPNTYSQISIQAVFAIQNRQHVIAKSWRDELHRYIHGILDHIGTKPLAIGGWKDHVHVFFGMPVTQNISDIISKVKSNSSRWINEKRFVAEKFNWQGGFGAFSYSRHERDRVIKYIINQEQHHRLVSFREEYLQMLQEFDIAFDHRYLFDFFD
jgi:putative transposase